MATLSTETCWMSRHNTIIMYRNFVITYHPLQRNCQPRLRKDRILAPTDTASQFVARGSRGTTLPLSTRFPQWHLQWEKKYRHRSGQRNETFNPNCAQKRNSHRQRERESSESLRLTYHSWSISRSQIVLVIANGKIFPLWATNRRSMLQGHGESPTLAMARLQDKFCLESWDCARRFWRGIRE